MSEEKDRTLEYATRALIAGTVGGGAAKMLYDEMRDERAERRKKTRAASQNRAQERGAKVSATKTELAKQERAQLQRIPDNRLSKEDQNYKRDMINQKNQTIKQNKQASTVKTMASKVAKAGKVLSPMGILMAVMSPTPVGNSELTQADRLAEEAKRQRR